MIFVTLFRECRLTNKYKEVFSPKPDSLGNLPLENYLYGELSTRQFQCDTVYQENQGTLIFEIDIDSDNDDSIYHYNYMKVETIDENNNILYKRYCFIDKISLKNGYCYVDYSEDIWHSYIDKLTGNLPCTLTKTKDLIDIGSGLYRLPIPYKSNDNITIANVANAYGTNQNYNIVMEIQYYETAQSGEETERHCDLFAVNLDGTQTRSVALTLAQTLQKIRGLVLDSSKTTLEFKITPNPSGTPTLWRYQIGKIYIFPDVFSVTQGMQEVNPPYQYLVGSTTLFRLEDGFPINPIKGWTITNDFKNLSIGTLSHQVKMTNNGTSRMLRLFARKFGTDLSLLMAVENQIVDITDDFIYDYPIKPMASEELSLLKLERNTKNQVATNNMINNLVQGVFGYKNNFESELNAAEKYRPGNNIQTIKDAFDVFTKYTRGAFLKGLDLGVSVVDYIYEMIHNNAYLFTSNEGKTEINEKFLNIQYGICMFKIEPENTNIVNYAINYYGYDVQEPITSIWNTDIFDTQANLARNVKYNPIKFDDITVYGSFPQEIANALAEILNNGTRIYYDIFE